jgi:hypothetical protein
MRIITSAEYVWSSRQDRYILLKEKSIIRTSAALCKGASAQQSSLADSQQAFYNQMTADYSQQFAQQGAILQSLQNTLNPIIAAGPNQQGFNTAELNTLNSQAVQGTGQQYNNAQKALGAQQAAQGGGNSYLPSGAQSAQQANVASAYANQASNQLLGIQQANYQQGYNTYESAIGQLGGVASQYNPTGYSNSATGAAGAANSEANAVAQANNAASPWNLVGGILGGAAGAGLDAFTGGLGGTAASSLGNLFGNGGSTTGGGGDD